MRDALTIPYPERIEVLTRFRCADDRFESEIVSTLVWEIVMYYFIYAAMLVTASVLLIATVTDEFSGR